MSKTVSVSSIQKESINLTGQVYLVTGSTGGLGRATALELAKHGATVILNGRNEKKLDKLYDDIEQAGCPTPAIIPFDLKETDEALYTQFAHAIYNEFKQLNGIIHAACHLGVVGPIGSQDGGEWQKVMQTNVNAAAMLSKACMPLLHQAESASITFITDSSARQHKAYWGAYGTSKIALESFSKILADELDASAITSNVFIPGPGILPIRKKTHPGEEEAAQVAAELIAEGLVKTCVTEQTGQTFTL